MGIVAGVQGLGPLSDPVKRRDGNIKMSIFNELRKFFKEKRHQERGDVGAIHVGVGHDDDALVAQGRLVVIVAGAAAQGLQEVTQFLVGVHLFGGGAGHVEDLAAQRQHRLEAAVAPLLGRAAGGIPLDQENLGALGGGLGAVGELAGQPRAARRRGALELARLLAVEALVGAPHHVVEELAGRLGVARQPVLEAIAHGGLDEARRLRRGQSFLGLALELRVLDEDRQHDGGAADGIIGGDLGGLAVAGKLAKRPQALGERRAQPLLVGTALGRRHGVAVGVEEFVLVGRPRHRPFHLAGIAVEAGLAGERLGHQGIAALEGGGQEVGEAAGEAQNGAFRRRLALAGEEGGCAAPANLDAAEKVRLGARHAVQTLWAEQGAGAEDLGVGMEGDLGAAPVAHRALGLQGAGRLAARVGLGPQLAVARHLDVEPLGERVDHRKPDPVQAARGAVGIAAELAARVQHGHDHFEGGFVLELGMGIDGNATAVVGDHHRVVGGEGDLDVGGVAGHGLVHGVVQNLRRQVVEGGLVGAADVHAGAPAHRLEAFQDLDVAGRIGALAGPLFLGRGAFPGGCGGLLRCLLPGLGVFEEIGHLVPAQ